MLVSFLDYYRETTLAKAAGLDAAQLRWKPRETSNSLIGLITHLSYVEDWWFRECFFGEPDDPVPWGDPADDDRDFKPPPDMTFEQAEALYRGRWARSNEITEATASLDEVALHPRGAKRGVTLRWILVHMIEETARHAGHADITRELIDGALGDG